MLKKALCMLLIVVSVFAFLTACNNGKCDECGAETKDVRVYDEEYCKGEYCLTCAAAEVVKNMKKKA